MGNLRTHAETELTLVGYGENCEGYNRIMRGNILELIDIFSEQGHSGLSRFQVLNIFSELPTHARGDGMGFKG